MVLRAGVGNYEWWKYFIMPFLSGFVGWITNVIALEMTFHPLEYKGINLYRMKNQPWGIIGWQGIVPTKVAKMAALCSDIMTTKLLDFKEIFARIDDKKLYDLMKDDLLVLVHDILHEVAEEYISHTWHSLPESIKEEIVRLANKECPDFFHSFIIDVKENIFQLLDVKEMIVTQSVKHKEKVNRIFLECGDKEFDFIRRSGFYFGFLFGLVQMSIWFLYDGNWILPVFGFIVGWLTNYVALKIIFRPLNPYKCCHFFTIQGIFIKRQVTVSEVFARVICEEILDTKTIWDSILNGHYHRNFDALLRLHSIDLVSKLIGGLELLFLAKLGKSKLEMMKDDVAGKICQKIPEIIPVSYDYITDAFQLQQTIYEKMKLLTPEEFENVLHPVFQEDEMTLIFLGGVLGMLVGVIQLFVVF